MFKLTLCKPPVIQDTPFTFKFYIHKAPPPDEEYKLESIETQRTGIDIEKYDKADPVGYIGEVAKLVAEGRDFTIDRTDATVAGMTVSEEFAYHVDRIRSKRNNNERPSWWDVRLAMASVMCLRAGFDKVSITCNSEHIVDGQVVDSAPDGSQVRLLFILPTNGYDHLRNQRYLPRHTAQWFNMSDGKATNPEIPFVLTDYFISRPFTKPGLKN